MPNYINLYNKAAIRRAKQRKRYINLYPNMSRFKRSSAVTRGNSKAAYQQRDATRVMINRIVTVSVSIANGNITGGYFMNLWNELLQSQFYPNYSQMYDQMKLNGIYVKVTGFSAASAQTLNVSPQVVTAFDRNGLDNVVTGSPQQGETPSTVTYSPQDVDYGTISTYSSAMLKPWSSGNAFITGRWIGPSTIGERAMYISTIQPTAAQLGADGTSTAGSSNISNPYQDPMFPFKPIFFIGVDQGVAAGATTTYAFKVEMEFSVTFRGMRKPSAVYLDGEGNEITPVPLLVSVTNSDFLRDPPEINYYYGPYTPVRIDLSTVDIPQNTSIQKTYTSNGTYQINPTEDAPDYDGFSDVTITVNVPSSSVYNLSGFVYVDIAQGSGNNYEVLDNVPSNYTRYNSWIPVVTTTTVQSSNSVDVVAINFDPFGDGNYYLSYVASQGSSAYGSMTLKAGSYYMRIGGNASTGNDSASVYYNGHLFAYYIHVLAGNNGTDYYNSIYLGDVVDDINNSE